MYNMGQSTSTCFNKFFKRIIIYPYLWINMLSILVESLAAVVSIKEKRSSQKKRYRFTSMTTFVLSGD